MPPAEVKILVGPATSGKTRGMLDAYRTALSQGNLGSVLWLSPTHRSCQEIRQQLIASSPGATLAPGVMTFEELAEGVIAASPLPVRGVSRLQKRHLLRQLVTTAIAEQRLNYFRPIADTSGFIDQLAEFISELKRLEVWPEDLAKVYSRGGDSAKNWELLTLYEAYQDELNRHHLYDAEGRFWSARAMLRGGQHRPFDRLRLVVADGFTDFTRTQHEILEILADRVDRLLVSLPMDSDSTDGPKAEREDSPRAHLFNKSLATLHEFHQRHSGFIIEHMEPCAAWPALAHIERHLFSDPRDVADAATTAGIEILAAGGYLSELQSVARRIKQLLLKGDSASGANRVWPEDIAVVFRSLGSRSTLVREVFNEFGLPAAFEASRRLGDAKIITAVVSLLRLDVDDWPFHQLLAVLSNTYLRPSQVEASQGAILAERVIRRAQIPKGRVALLGWLQHRVEREAEAETGASAIAYGEALSWFQWLAATLDAMPERATPRQWAEALRALVEVEVCQTEDEGPQAEGGSGEFPSEVSRVFDEEDRMAWRRLTELLESLEEIERHTAGHSKAIDRAELLALLTDLAATERLPDETDETGCIRVMSAQSVRGLRVPYLFVVDLAENEFPSSHAGDRLYNEAESLELTTAGLPLRNRAEHHSEEMLLFYEVITRATRRLYLSYAAWTEKADPLLPSPFLADVRRACGRTAIETVEVHDLSPLPQQDEPYSDREWRVLGVAQALAGRPELMASLWSDAATSTVASGMLAAVDVYGKRGRGEVFSDFEGVLGPAASHRLGERFGPNHVWSAAELELYATCPYKFFAERVLKLEPLEALELETDYGRRGSVAHDALAAMHRRLLVDPEATRSMSSVDADEFESMLKEELARLLDVAEVDRTVGGAMRLIDRRRLTADLSGYVDSHQQYDARWKDCTTPPSPQHFEVSFGLERISEDPLSTLEPLVLQAHGESFKVGGRIDRIDLGQVAGELIFNVLDYKTGQIPGAQFKTLIDKDALQLPLYVLATEDVLLGSQAAVAFAAGYWTLSRTTKSEFKAAIGLASVVNATLQRAEAYDQLRAWLADRVWSLVHGAREGQFPMVNRDEKCTSTCEFSTVCRVNQVRSLEKLWQPPIAPTS